MVRRLRASSSVSALGDALRNRSIRRIEMSWATGVAADWAYLVIVLVVAYDAGGARAAGILGAVRIAPAIVAAPFATALVERFRGDRVLTAINVARSAGALATAGAIALDLPLAVVFALAAVVAGAGALVRPIQSALLPAFARTPKELVAANVTSSLGEGAGTFDGPLLASGIVAATDSSAASLLVASAFAAAAAAVTGVRFERAADARAGRAEGEGSRFRLRDVPRTIVGYPTTAVLLVDLFAQVFVRGLLITLIVVASIELLGLGDSGVGLLNAAIGLGGLVGALGALTLTDGRRLRTVFLVALAFWGLPLVLIGAWPVVAIALAGLVVTGFSNAALDVAGFTLIQRDTRNEDRITIFALVEVLVGLGILAGSLAAPVLVTLFGARGALVAAGAILPVMALATWRPITRGAPSGVARDERLALLRRNPLFAPLPLTALDVLAESMTPVSFAAGATLMRKGELGEDYVVIASGEVEVSDDGVSLGKYGPGDGVGEIALLREVPRTATVVAREPVEAFSIDRDAFLGAMTGYTARAAAEQIVAQRLGEARGG